MTDIKVSTLSVPRIPRNKRIYSDYKTERISIGTPETVVTPTRNIQAKILSYDNGDFTTKTIEIKFDTPFSLEPVGSVKAYRYDTRIGGGYFKTNAVVYLDSKDWKTPTGFRVIVEDYEDLNGLFIEYLFTERSDIE